MYPEDCESPVGGPSNEVGPCSEKAWDATAQLAVSGAALLGIGAEVYGGYAAGFSLTVLGWGVVIGGIAAASFAAGYYVGKWMACKGIEPLLQAVSAAGNVAELMEFRHSVQRFHPSSARPFQPTGA
jgi:hypothetical protein